MEDKPKYQVTDGWNPSDTPIFWRRLPESVLEHVSGRYYIDIYSFNVETGEIETKPFIHVRKTAKFRKDVVAHETDSYIIGA